MSSGKRDTKQNDRQAKMTRLAVGVMSGTSIDGLDAALVRLDGAGLDVHASLLIHMNAPLGDLAPRLRAIAEQVPVTAEEIATVSWELGLLHVKLIERLLITEPSQPAIICIHGQTVYHRPPISWQLINPAPIAAHWPDATVISDLRQEDLAQDGQGAPITPLADWILFRDGTHSRAVANLGGFCNITIIPRESAKSQGLPSLGALAGFDLCPCNHILDAIARQTMNAPFDEGGRRALAGSVNREAESQLQETLANQRAIFRGRANFRGRSLGTGDESLGWVADHGAHLAPNDLAATACSAIGRTIAAAISERDIDQLILAGGGAFNEALVGAIKATLPCEVIRSDALGVPVQAREAIAMAILGALRTDGIPITLPQITGRRP